MKNIHWDTYYQILFWNFGEALELICRIVIIVIGKSSVISINYKNNYHSSWMNIIYVQQKLKEEEK